MSTWPQFTYLFLIAMSFGVNMSRLGQPKEDSYDLFDLLVAPAIVLTLLYCGGFFAPLGWSP